MGFCHSELDEYGNQAYGNAVLYHRILCNYTAKRVLVILCRHILAHRMVGGCFDHSTERNIRSYGSKTQLYGKTHIFSYGDLARSFAICLLLGCNQCDHFIHKCKNTKK